LHILGFEAESKLGPRLKLDPDPIKAKFFDRTGSGRTHSSLAVNGRCRYVATRNRLAVVNCGVGIPKKIPELTS
jgi:hypothetical protein